MTFSDGLTTFINKTQMPSLGALNSQVVWLFGSIMLTIADYQMLLVDNSAMREGGIVVCGMLLSAWTGKSYLNLRGNKQQRETSREFLQAQADLKQAEASVATAEHAAVLVNTQGGPAKVDATTAAVTAIPAKPSTEPNAMTDDERGEDAQLEQS